MKTNLTNAECPNTQHSHRTATDAAGVVYLICDAYARYWRRLTIDEQLTAYRIGGAL